MFNFWLSLARPIEQARESRKLINMLYQNVKNDNNFSRAPKRNLKVIIGILLFSLGFNPVFAQSKESLPKKYELLDDFIQEKFEDDDLVGLNVAVVVEDKIVWQKSYGYSNEKLGLRATRNTMYQIGALSGTFTAALTLHLADIGLINIDDNILNYLPNLKIRYRNDISPVITIRHLLTHHAGLPINIFKDSWNIEPVSIQTLISSGVEINASYLPEIIYGFSNVGYSLLGLIIEKVTKLSFSDAMKKYVFSVQNMSTSSVNHHDEVMKNLAVGYKDGDPQTKIFPRDTPSVGMATSIEDLAKFIPLYFKDKQNRWKGLKESIKTQNSDVLLDIEKKVGYTWNINGLNIKGGGPVIWRGGTTPYFRSRVSMLPKHEIAVIVLSNDSRSWKAINEISEKALSLLLAYDFNIKQPEGSPIISATESIQNSAFANTYSSFLGLVSMSNKNDSLKAKIIGWPISLVKDKNNKQWYNLQYDLLGFIPIDISWISQVKVRPAIIDGHSVLIAHYKGRKILFGNKLEQKNIHPRWKSLVGKYKIRNQDTLTKVMKIEEGDLIIRNNRLFFTYDLPVWFGLKLEIPVSTISNSIAIVPGLGTGLNETISNRTIDGKRVLMYSGYILEKQNNDDKFNFDF